MASRKKETQVIGVSNVPVRNGDVAFVELPEVERSYKDKCFRATVER